VNHSEAQDIREHLEEMPVFALKEMFRAFRLLDTSLTATCGPDWLERSSAFCIPHDLYSVLTGNLTPDDRGILRSKEVIR